MLWLDSFLIANGATTANWKATIVVINIVCVVFFFYLLFKWWFDWRPTNKKLKKNKEERKHTEQIKTEINDGGKYIVDSDTAFFAKITRLK